MQSGHSSDVIGIEPNSGYLAADRLRPRVQEMINARIDLGIVMLALGEAFFGCLKVAGASTWQIEKASSRLLEKLRRHGVDRAAVESAYAHIADELAALHAEGIDPKAVAFALAAAMTRVSRSVPGINPSAVDRLLDDLLAHINAVPNKMP